MSPDHLCEEGLAHREEIEIPFNIIFSFSIILIFLYGIHLNRHFYLFGLVTRIFLWIYHLLSRLHHALLYWYFILHFNHHAGQKKTTPDSTKSRDHNTDQQLLLVTTALDTDAFLTLRPQITFFQQNHFDEIRSIVTYVANATHIVPKFPNLPVTISTLQISEAPILIRFPHAEIFHVFGKKINELMLLFEAKLMRDICSVNKFLNQQLQEFLIGEECCRNFIHQDLTFLQPLTVYETTELDDSISSASDLNEVSVISPGK